MKPSFRAFAVTALVLLTSTSCRLDSAPAVLGPSGPHGTSDPALDPNRVVMPAPERTSSMSTRTGVQSGADSADDGSAGRGGDGIAVATGSDAGEGGRGGSSSADAGGAGSAQPPSAGDSGGPGGVAAGSGGTVATGGSGDVAGRDPGVAGAGAAGNVASAGSGGRSQPQAGRGGPAGDGGDDAATFNELIDKLSNALTAQQRARIVQALTSNSVTPQQLNQLLDAVTKAGSCDDAHASCQQLCRLVLNACPTCMSNRMTAEKEQARCDSL